MLGYYTLKNDKKFIKSVVDSSNGKAGQIKELMGIDHGKYSVYSRK